jgi:hypothetical protein
VWNHSWYACIWHNIINLRKKGLSMTSWKYSQNFQHKNHKAYFQFQTWTLLKVWKISEKDKQNVRQRRWNKNYKTLRFIENKTTNMFEFFNLKLPSPSIKFAPKKPLNVYHLYSSKALWFKVKIDKIRNHLTWMKKFSRFWFGEHFYIWKCQIGQYLA